MKTPGPMMTSFLKKLFTFALLGFVPTAAEAQALLEAADAKKENFAETVAVDANVRSAAYASYMRHEYALQQDGNLKGKVRIVDAGGALTPARVKLFFVRHGEVVSQASPNSEGVFQATGLTPGYYSVIADGASGMSSTGVRVVPAPEKVEAPKANTIGRKRFIANAKADADVKEAAEAPGADWLYITPIPTIDIAAADRLDELQNGPRVGAAGNPVANQATIRTVAAKAADSVMATADSNASELVSMSSDMMADAYERSAYYLDPNGKLSGRLTHFDLTDKLVPTPNTGIFFLQQGRVVARATTNPQGFYEATGLVPGSYSFVVAGSGQYGAMGIQLYPAPAELVPATKIKSVSFNNSALQQGGNGPSAGGGRSGDNRGARGGAGGGGAGAGGGFPGQGGGGGVGGGGGGAGGLGAAFAAGAAGLGAGFAGGGGNGGGQANGNSGGNGSGSPATP